MKRFGWIKVLYGQQGNAHVLNRFLAFYHSIAFRPCCILYSTIYTTLYDEEKSTRSETRTRTNGQLSFGGSIRKHVWCAEYVWLYLSMCVRALCVQVRNSLDKQHASIRFLCFQCYVYMCMNHIKNVGHASHTYRMSQIFELKDTYSATFMHISVNYKFKSCEEYYI